jgi:hypothetical protein
LLLLFASLASACSRDPSPLGVDAGTDPPDAAGPPCDGTGITKGPWTLAIDGASAKVRWEACRAGVTGKVTVTPEAGGEAKEFTSAESTFEVTETFIAPFNDKAQPDFAGTYYMHEASLTDLAQGTCYRYELAADAIRKGRFCTARAPGDLVRFMVIGDTNPALGGHTERIIASLLPKNFDFTLHGGDLQYYSSTLETWAYWFQWLQPMLAQGGFFPAIGNHESEMPGEFEQYYLRFFGTAGFDGTDRYFRFESGGVHFFALDTEQALDLGSLQGTWLSAGLDEASKAPGYRFSVLYFHKPLVTCGDKGDSPSVKAQLEPLFAQYKVPLVIQAHMHGYERFTINNTVYLTSGGGGGVLGEIDENNERAYCAMRASSGAFKHAVLIEIGATEIKGTVIDADGMERDAFTHPTP